MNEILIKEFSDEEIGAKVKLATTLSEDGTPVYHFITILTGLLLNQDDPDYRIYESRVFSPTENYLIHARRAFQSIVNNLLEKSL